jgi:hypothetical protein
VYYRRPSRGQCEAERSVVWPCPPTDAPTPRSQASAGRGQGACTWTLQARVRNEWREGSAEPLSSRFARVRIRVAHGDNQRGDPRPQEWLLIEWPKDEGRTDQILACDAARRYRIRSLGRSRQTTATLPLLFQGSLETIDIIGWSVQWSTHSVKVLGYS